jgi:hypothetical protein
VLSRRRRVLALLVPRVTAQWPAIAAIALAVVLAHSGWLHLGAPPDVAQHYREAIGTGDWSRAIGILQLLAAGGLCLRPTRATTAAAFAAIVLIGVGNQVVGGRAGVATVTSLILIAWAVAVAWGEMRANAR